MEATRNLNWSQMVFRLSVSSVPSTLTPPCCLSQFCSPEREKRDAAADAVLGIMNTVLDSPDVLIMVPSVCSHRGLTGSVLGDRWTLPTHTPVTPQHSLLNIGSFLAPGKLGHRVCVPSICYVDVLFSLLALS